MKALPVTATPPTARRNCLKNELPTYWTDRKTLIETLRYFERIGLSSQAWHEDAHVAGLVAGAMENDHG